MADHDVTPPGGGWGRDTHTRTYRAPCFVSVLWWSSFPSRFPRFQGESLASASFCHLCGRKAQGWQAQRTQCSYRELCCESRCGGFAAVLVQLAVAGKPLPGGGWRRAEAQQIRLVQPCVSPPVRPLRCSWPCPTQEMAESWSHRDHDVNHRLNPKAAAYAYTVLPMSGSPTRSARAHPAAPAAGGPPPPLPRTHTRSTPVHNALLQAQHPCCQQPLILSVFLSLSIKRDTCVAVHSSHCC
jgi:hypothetical protein